MSVAVAGLFPVAHSCLKAVVHLLRCCSLLKMADYVAELKSELKAALARADAEAQLRAAADARADAADARADKATRIANLRAVEAATLPRILSTSTGNSSKRAIKDLMTVFDTVDVPLASLHPVTAQHSAIAEEVMKDLRLAGTATPPIVVPKRDEKETEVVHRFMRAVFRAIRQRAAAAGLECLKAHHDSEAQQAAKFPLKFPDFLFTAAHEQETLLSNTAVIVEAKRVATSAGSGVDTFLREGVADAIKYSLDLYARVPSRKFVYSVVCYGPDIMFVRMAFEDPKVPVDVVHLPLVDTNLTVVQPGLVQLVRLLTAPSPCFGWSDRPLVGDFTQLRLTYERLLGAGGFADVVAVKCGAGAPAHLTDAGDLVYKSTRDLAAVQSLKTEAKLLKSLSKARVSNVPALIKEHHDGRNTVGLVLTPRGTPMSSYLKAHPGDCVNFNTVS